LGESVERISDLNSQITDSGSFDTRMGIGFFSAVMNGFAMPCFLIDETYRIIFANHYAGTLAGSSDQFVGESLFTFFTENVDRVKFFIQQTFLERTAVTIPAWVQIFENRHFVRASFRSIRAEDQRLLMLTLQDFTDAVRKIHSTETRADELLAAYKEVISNLATNEATIYQRGQVMRLIIDSVGSRLKEERQQLVSELSSHIKPLINRLKGEKMSDRAVSLLNTLETFLDDTVSTSELRSPAFYNALTPRETEICDLISSGYSSKEMAEALGLSLETVATHRGRIRKKLGLAPGQSIYTSLKSRSSGVVHLPPTSIVK